MVRNSPLQLRGDAKLLEEIFDDFAHTLHDEVYVVVCDVVCWRNDDVVATDAIDRTRAGVYVDVVSIFESCHNS
jgi:hypothetical protein